MPRRNDDFKTEPTEALSAPGSDRRAREGDTVEKRVGRVDSLTVYEVTDDELIQLEEGSPDSIMLTLAIFCFGSCISLLPTFFAAAYSSVLMQAVFACITVVAFLAGVILTVLWRSFGRSRAVTFAKIRKRGAENETSDVGAPTKARIAPQHAAPPENEAALEGADTEMDAQAERARK